MYIDSKNGYISCVRLIWAYYVICGSTWCALFGYSWPTQAHAHFPQDIRSGSLPRHVAINHCLREHKHNITS